MDLVRNRDTFGSKLLKVKEVKPVVSNSKKEMVGGADDSA
jgi:hypothetical protein